MTTSTPKGLIGKRETQTLEFKSAEVLKNPVTVAREVVAFLNAEGGDVWIGVKETDGVASAAEEISGVAAKCADLRNHLIDTIEPSPTNSEVDSEVVDQTIRVRVTKGLRKPYALRKDRGRQYVLRIGDRIREMTREEIATEFRGSHSREETAEKEESITRDKVKQAIDEERKSKRARFWWQLVVPRPLGARFAESDKKFFEDLLTNPRTSGNRPNGWTMTSFHDRLPRQWRDRVEHTFGEGDFEHQIKINIDGTMTFVAPLLRLNRVPWESDVREIFSFPLLELPVSAFRIASKVLDRYGVLGSGKVVCGAVLGGIGGVILRPGSPNEPSRPWKHPGKLDSDVDDLAVGPFTVGADEVTSKPDMAAYQLIWQLYGQFGLMEEDIPREFDRQSGVLRLSG